MTDTTGARELVIRWMVEGGQHSRAFVDLWFSEGNHLILQRDEIHQLITFIDSYAAKREALARSDERERCADRAIAWQKKLCENDNWPCSTCTECDQLRTAIKEDGK
jgi:hypothetical protein